jgi:hypothetical protein
MVQWFSAGILWGWITVFIGRRLADKVHQIRQARNRGSQNVLADTPANRVAVRFLEHHIRNGTPRGEA